MIFSAQILAAALPLADPAGFVLGGAENAAANAAEASVSVVPCAKKGVRAWRIDKGPWRVEARVMEFPAEGMARRSWRVEYLGEGEGALRSFTVSAGRVAMDGGAGKIVIPLAFPPAEIPVSALADGKARRSWEAPWAVVAETGRGETRRSSSPPTRQGPTATPPRWRCGSTAATWRCGASSTRAGASRRARRG